MDFLVYHLTNFSKSYFNKWKIESIISEKLPFASQGSDGLILAQASRIPRLNVPPHLVRSFFRTLLSGILRAKADTLFCLCSWKGEREFMPQGNMQTD